MGPAGAPSHQLSALAVMSEEDKGGLAGMVKTHLRVTDRVRERIGRSDLHA